jgi:hypothetical protein
MKLSTEDLYNYSPCPRKYFLTDFVNKKDSPPREAIKRIVLLKALGRENKWTTRGLASLWDSIFWKNRDVTQENINRTTRGVISLRKLYKLLPEEFDSYSSENLKVMIDGNIELSSSSDFMIVTDKTIDLWIFKRDTPTNIRRSILPAAERYVLEASLRGSFKDGTSTLSKGFKGSERQINAVVYYPTTGGLNPSYFKVRCDDNSTAVRMICEQLRRKIEYPIRGYQCNECPLDC